MLRFECWSDFFKANKDILDEDYPTGQVVAVKQKKWTSDKSCVSLRSVDSLLGIYQ